MTKLKAMRCGPARRCEFNDHDIIIQAVAQEIGLAAEHIFQRHRSHFPLEGWRYYFVDGSWIPVHIIGCTLVFGKMFQPEEEPNMSGAFSNPKRFDLNDPNFLDHVKDEISINKEAQQILADHHWAYLPQYPPGTNCGEIYVDDKRRAWEWTTDGWRTS